MVPWGTYPIVPIGLITWHGACKTAVIFRRVSDASSKNFRWAGHVHRCADGFWRGFRDSSLHAEPYRDTWKYGAGLLSGERYQRLFRFFDQPDGFNATDRNRLGDR